MFLFVTPSNEPFEHLLYTQVPELVPGFRQSIRQVSAGRGYSVFLDDEGTVYTFGENAEGQLGQGHFDACYTEPRVVKALAGVNIVQISAATGGAHTLFLDSCGTPWSCGRGQDGELGFGHMVRGVLCCYTNVSLNRITLEYLSRTRTNTGTKMCNTKNDATDWKRRVTSRAM